MPIICPCSCRQLDICLNCWPIVTFATHCMCCCDGCTLLCWRCVGVYARVWAAGWACVSSARANRENRDIITRKQNVAVCCTRERRCVGVDECCFLCICGWVRMARVGAGCEVSAHPCGRTAANSWNPVGATCTK